MFIRTFDATGTPTSGYVIATDPLAPSSSYALYPSVSADAADDFVVVWNQGGATPSEVQGRLGDSTGTLQPVFTVAGVNSYYPHGVGMTAAGDFVVAWADNGDFAYTDLFVRRYDATGSPVAGPISVRSSTTEQYTAPGIALDGSGGFVVAWAEGAGAAPWNMKVQRYDAADVPLGSEITVSTDGYEETNEGPQRSAIASNASGEFVVVFERYTTSGIFAQRYDATGTPVGGTLTVSPDGGFPDVAVAADGDFVVVWHYSSEIVSGRHFSATSAAFGDTFQVNESTAYGVQGPAAVSMTPDGFVVAWDSEEIMARLFEVPTGGVGITGKKLVIVDNLALTGKAKTVYVSKLDAGIAKGAAGDPALLSGSLEVFYTDTPETASGRFVLPSPWQKNEGVVAKYVNSLAPAAPGHVKVAVVKDGLLAKVAAKGLGDDPSIDLFTGPPSAGGGVTTILTIVNAADDSVHRMCARFATDDGSTVDYKSIAQGTGRKLIAKGGVPTACP